MVFLLMILMNPEKKRFHFSGLISHDQDCNQDCNNGEVSDLTKIVIMAVLSLPFSMISHADATFHPFFLQMHRGFSRMKLHCFEKTFSHSAPSLTPIKLPSPLETHLWYVKPSEVKSESLLNHYLDILPLCERENVSRVQSGESRKSALLARALVRTTISRYQINSHTNPRSLKFRKNLHGKPEIEWQITDNWCPPPLHFNISHTCSLVACGVTTNSHIGIDVEEKHRKIKHNVISFAQRYFSKHELRFLASISDPQAQHMEFIKLWTLKEAYVKALGKGFSGAPFKKFTIHVEGVDDRGFNSLDDSSHKASEITVESLETADLTNNWQFVLLELYNSHYVAICTEKHDDPQGEINVQRKLTVWETIPFLEDVCVSGTEAVKTICGLQ